jgi:hypothetical protein
MKFYVTERIGPKQSQAPEGFCRAKTSRSRASGLIFGSVRDGSRKQKDRPKAVSKNWN